jgi:hypothetical protein
MGNDNRRSPTASMPVDLPRRCHSKAYESAVLASTTLYLHSRSMSPLSSAMRRQRWFSPFGHDLSGKAHSFSLKDKAG